MRKQSVLLATMLVGFSMASPGRAQGAGSTSPDRLSAPGQVDLGAFPYGPQVVKGSFTLRNAGREPLNVRRIRSSCLCLVVNPLEANLAPGAAMTVTLALDLGYREGSWVHPVMIYTDDPGRPITRVDVKVSVPTAVKYAPRANLFGLVHKGPELATRRFDLAIFAVDRRPLAAPRVTSTSPYLRAAETIAQKTPEGIPYQLVKLAIDPSIPYGEYNESLLIETMHPDQPKLTVPARWRVVPDLVAADPVDPGLMEEGRAIKGTFVVRNLGSRPVNVLRTAANLGVPAEVSVAPKDKDLAVTVSIPGGAKPWALRGTIDLYTDLPDQPMFTLRVAGKVWAHDPFARIASDSGGDAEFFDIVKDALLNEEAIPMPVFLKSILGGVNDSRATTILLRALHDGDYFPTRSRAAIALGELRAKDALEDLKRASTYDSDDEVRREAATAVFKIIGKDALPVIELLLQDDEEFSRERAAELLGEIDDPRAVLLLQGALKDPEPIVVQTARESLKKRGIDETAIR